MIRFDYFLDAMRTLGVNTSESRIKELLDVKPTVQFWGWQTYICNKDVKRVIDFYWKIISPNDVSAFESVRKIEFVSQMILQQKEIGAIGQNPTREANQAELNELFHDIKEGTDLALEMQRRGFAPIINDFDFSKTRLQYLIIDGVKFNRCNGANFINCYIRKTKVPTHSNFTNCLYLREGEPIPQLHEVSSLISHLKTNVTDLIMQTIKDASEFGNAREILEEFLKKYQGNGSQLWIEFAAIAAKINAYTFRRCFQKFGIKDEEARYNCALLDAGFLSWDYCFEDFNITNQEYLNQLALEYIKHNPDDLIRMIQIFKISDPDIKIKLALIAARSDGTNLARNIHLLGITDQKALVEIALLCAKKRYENTNEHFEKFGIKDPYSRYQIALECIKQDIWSLCHLKNFKLNHQQEIDLALTIAEEQCIAAYIEYFTIADESIRIAIAKKCARVSGGVTAQFIKDFDIKDKKVLIEIAFESVNNGHTPVVHIGNFEINDQAVLTELARKCAQVYPSGTLYYLVNFKLKDKAELKSIVKLCLKDGIPDSKTFKLIGDTPENRAEILIQFLAETTLVYADLLEQKELFDVLPGLGDELTLEAMDQLHFEGLDIEVNKQSFKKIQNEYAQKQTAFWLVNTLTLLHPVINAEQRIWLNKTRMLNHIQKIEDPKVRWRLTGCLHKILMQNKQDCFEKIEVKNLESEKGKKAEKSLYLIELMCVILKGKNVSVDLIKKYQKIFIDDSAKLNVFLKAFSRLVNDDKLDAKSFENLIKRIFENEHALIRSLSFLSAIYELNEERALFDSGNIEGTLRQILQDKIKDIITIDDAAAEKLYHLFGNFRNPVKDEDILADIAYMCMKHCSPAKAQFLERIFIEKGVSAKVLLKKVNSESVFNIECNIKSLDKITNPHAQMQTIFWLCNAITLLQKMSPSQQNWIDNHQFLLHIQKVDDPVLRTNLLMCLNELISKQLNLENFEGIKVNVSSNKGKKLESSLYLIELMLAFIKSNKVTVDLIKQNSRFFVSDTYKLNVFLRAFSKIVMDAFLNEAALTCIAKNLFEKPELMLKRLSFVSVIYDFKEQARFRYHRGTIESVLKVILQEKLTNFIEVDERTADKLQMVFGASRNPEALYIYVSNLSTLGDSSLNNAVKEFLRAVVDDRFQGYRYDISKNTHLNQINGYDADLLEKWKANSQCMFGGADSKEKIDFQEWFKQKLMVDGHYPKEKMKALWAFLNKQKCDEPLDDMQRLCIELIKDPENDVTVKLMQLQKLVKNTEFENDVSALLIKPRKISEDAIVVNTDDPVDFLLCGTDIKSSCQRVDGNAKYNKGLLGYLLNGQTRLLAVKTKAGAGGSIQARCLLRLLWDEKRKMPVLFRERFYGADAKEALNKLAISKAEEMGLDLLSLDEGDVHYENPIMSLGGRAPYEYVDASEDGMKHSEYTIYAARLIKKGKKRRREEG